MTSPHPTPRAWVEFQISGIAPTPDDFRAFLTDAGINPDQDFYTPIEVKSLIIKAMLTLQDESYGHFPTKIPIGTTNLLLDLMHSGRTLREGIALVDEFSSKYPCHLKIQTHTEGGRARANLLIDGISAESGAAMELSTAVVFMHSASTFISEPIPVDSFHSRSRIYTSLVKHNGEMNCSVHSANVTGICFDEAYLDMPRRGLARTPPLSSATLIGILMTKLNGPGGISPLPIIGADPILREVDLQARRRNIGERQKRRLAYELSKSNLRDLDRGAKAARAMILLSTTDRPISAISEELGFSDERAFRRFFHGAAGSTPSAYRRLNQESTAADGKDLLSAMMLDLQRLA